MTYIGSHLSHGIGFGFGRLGVRFDVGSEFLLSRGESFSSRNERVLKVSLRPVSAVALESEQRSERPYNVLEVISGNVDGTSVVFVQFGFLEEEERNVVHDLSRNSLLLNRVIVHRFRESLDFPSESILIYYDRLA